MHRHRTADEAVFSDSRRGVAIILVLGIVALLMLMGVAFSITMRFERTGAGNFQQQVATRQFIGAAIAQVMDDIDTLMASGGDDYLYPRWGGTASGGVGDGSPAWWGRALDYIPAALYDTSLRPGWSDRASAGGLSGRIAYTVFNESGLVDANFVGGLDRGAGTNAQEVAIDIFPSVLNADELVTTRDLDQRYETLAEFRHLQQDRGLRAGYPDYFSVYSRAPRGALLDDGTVYTNQVYLGDDHSNWPARRNAILDRLQRAGIANAQDRQFIYNALIDYADEDSVPQDLTGPNTEAVPMLNEVHVSRHQLTRVGGSTWTSSADIDFEFTYPFVRGSDLSFKATGTVETEIQVVGGASSTFSDSIEAELGSPGARSFLTFTESLPARQFTASNQTVRITFSVNNMEVKLSAAADGHPADTVVDRAATVSLPVVSVAINGADTYDLGDDHRSMESIDARFNIFAQTWRPHPDEDDRNTIGARNHWTDEYFRQRYAQIGLDRGTDAHVANAGRLSSPAELGFLLRGRTVQNSHRTIRLTDHPSNTTVRIDRVLDYFTCDEDAVAYGRVSLNTLELPVLGAVFRETPLDYPDSGRTISDLQSAAIVNAIWDWRVNQTNVFRNVSDIGRLRWHEIPEFREASEHEIESVIAHSSGLLTTRHNYFTVLVDAMVYRTAAGMVAGRAGIGHALASEKALVQLWRDPFPDANGRHHWRVNHFRWIGGD